MGFQEDIESILEKTPNTRQTLLFSATVPEGIQRLGRRFLKQPEFLKLSGDYVSVHDIRHVYYSIPGIQREEELLRIVHALAGEDAQLLVVAVGAGDRLREDRGIRRHPHDPTLVDEPLEVAADEPAPREVVQPDAHSCRRQLGRARGMARSRNTVHDPILTF
jgi:hypothetical protein